MKTLSKSFTLMTLTVLALMNSAKGVDNRGEQISAWLGKDLNDQHCTVVVTKTVSKSNRPEIQGTYHDSTGPKNFKVFLAMFDSPNSGLNSRRPHYFEGAMEDTNISQKIVVTEIQDLSYGEAKISIAIETGAPVVIRKCSWGVPPKKED